MPSARAPRTRPQKVLVVGDDARSFLAVVRSLGRRAIEVHAAPIIRTSLALSSRYIAAIHHLPSYEGDGQRWCADAKRLLDRESFDLVIPMDDRSIIPFHLHRAEFEPSHRLALPNPEAFAAMFSKQQTRELAMSLDIPVARGRPSGAHETADSLSAEFGCPLVLKPLASFSISSLYQKRQVRTVETKDQLKTYLAGEFSSDDFVIEAHFPGTGLGVSVLANAGEILQAFEHHRVHEPPGGGGSSYRVSAPIQPPLLEACAKFCRALGYTGVAMFEFKQNPDTGSWILLEVNGRFWGSLPLAIAAGIDFPALLFDLLVLESDLGPQPYKLGIYSRSLGDDYWYYRFKASQCRRSAANVWPLLAETIREVGHVVSGVERIDTLALDDLRPAVRDVSSLLALPFKRLSRLVMRRWYLFRLLERRRINRALHQKRVGRPLKLLFVCKGNICRSPFAEALARSALPPEVICESAGILPLSGRAPPREAIECARKFGIDSSGHRSRILSDDMLSNDILIFVFDLENRAYLRETYPAMRDRVFLLGSYAAADDPTCEIADPYGGSSDQFRQSFQRICGAVKMLVEQIKIVDAACAA